MASDETYSAEFLYPEVTTNFVFTSKDTLNATWESDYVDPTTLVLWCNDGEAEINIFQRLEESSGSQLVGLGPAKDSENCHFEFFFMDDSNTKWAINSGRFQVVEGTKNDSPTTQGLATETDSPTSNPSSTMTTVRPTTTSTSIGHTTAAATETNMTDSDQVLSTGAKACIGVGVGGGILILLGALHLAWRWRAKRQRSKHPLEPELSSHAEKFPHSYPVEAFGQPRAEVDAVETAIKTRSAELP